MVAGGLNPKDVAHATTTRPTRIVGGVNQRRWFSDALRTQADSQDFNDVIAQIRYVWDFYSITDVEGDDTLLQQAIAAAALSLTGNLAAFQAVTASADRVAYFTGGSSMSTFVATTYSRNLMANTNAAQWRDALGVSSVFSDNITAFAALTSNADLLPYFTGPGTMAMATFSAFARTLIDDADAATMRTTLGFGSGVPSAFFQSIVDDADAATMRGTLGLAAVAASASASDLSAGTLPSARLPASLSSIYGLTPAADRLPYYTGASTAALATFTAYGRSLVDDVDAATARTTLGLAAIAASGSASDLSAGTLPSARLPASLSIVYGLTPAADQIAYYTSGVAGALTTLSAFGRTLIDDADAATARATLSAAAATHTHAAADIVSGTLASGLFPASLSSIYGLTPAADRLPYYTSGTTAALATFSAFARTLLDDADAATMQTTLGLAAIAVSASASDLTTGTLASARLPTSLSSIYGLTPAADRLPYYSGASTAALATFTAFGRSLVDDADAATARATLGLAAVAASGSAADLTVGTLASARLPASLSSIYGLTPAADRLPYYSGASTAALATFTAFGRSLVDDADAATARTTLGAADIAGDTFTGDIIVVGNITTTAGAIGVNRTGDAAGAGIFLQADAGFTRQITVYTGAVIRWNLAFASGAAESGGNAGSNFTLQRYDDAGAFIDNPISIVRSTGIAAFSQSPTAPTPTAGDNTTKVATTAFVAAGFQPLDADLTAIAGLTSAADRLPYFTGASAAALATFTAFARTLLDDADAATARTTLGAANIAGDTFTGGITVQGSITASGGPLTITRVGGGAPAWMLFQADAGQLRQIAVYTGSVLRWNMAFASGAAESGGNAGSNFALQRYDDAGVLIDNPFSITRSTGIAAFTQSPTAPTPTAGDSTTKLATTAFIATSFANLAGGTFTGAVTVQGNITTNAGLLAIDRSGDAATAQIQLKADSGQARQILGYTGTLLRWAIAIGNNTAESGGDAGSNLVITRCDDAGVSVDVPFQITRSTGVTTFSQSPTAPTPTAGDSTTRLATTAFVAAGFQPLPYVDSKGLEYTNADNLLDNPSFELGDYGWGHNTSSSPAAASSPYAITTGDTANAHHGGAYASIAYSGVASNRIFYANRVLDAHDGEEYYAEAYVKTSADYASATGYRVELLCYDAAGTLLVLNNGPLVTTANNPWTRNRCALRVPSGLGAKSLFFRVVSYAQTAGTVYIDTTSMRRVDNILPANPYNYVDNPQFELWQAGTSFAIAANTNTFIADRWKTRRSATGTTISKGTAFAGARQSLRMQRNSGDTTVNTIQVFTQLDPVLVQNLQGKDTALSFDHIAGADYSGGVLTVVAYFGTADEVFNMSTLAFATGPTNQTFPTIFSANLTAINATPATTARRYKSDSPTALSVVTVPSNAVSMALRFLWIPTGTAGANDWVQITNVLLQEGVLCSDFKPLTPEAMERQCLRFYQKSFERDTTPVQNAGVGTGEELMPAPAAGAAAERLSRVRFPVPMRAVPAITLYNPAVANAQLRDETAAADCSAAATADISQKGFQATCTGNAATVVGGNIGFHWTADAQL